HSCPHLKTARSAYHDLAVPSTSDTLLQSDGGGDELVETQCSGGGTGGAIWPWANSSGTETWRHSPQRHQSRTAGTDPCAEPTSPDAGCSRQDLPRPAALQLRSKAATGAGKVMDHLARWPDLYVQSGAGRDLARRRELHCR